MESHPILDWTWRACFESAFSSCSCCCVELMTRFVDTLGLEQGSLVGRFLTKGKAMDYDGFLALLLALLPAAVVFRGTFCLQSYPCERIMLWALCTRSKSLASKKLLLPHHFLSKVFPFVCCMVSSIAHVE